MYLWDVHKGNFYKYEVYPHGHISMLNHGDLLSKAAGTSNGSGADYYWENFL
jgi:tetrahydromethanopterin S-methyltransferase subunit E